MFDIIIKKSSGNIIQELNSIGFDSSYIEVASKKYTGSAYKIFNLKPYEANILKQICLSIGCDCALNRNSITCQCETTDCIIFASNSQYKKVINKLKLQPFRLKELSRKLDFILKTELTPIKIRNYTFDWTKPYIMGILNVTPDSFSDGGNYLLTDKAFEHALKMIEYGADIIDIGGESSRPGAKRISPECETDRIIPVIKKLRQEGINIPISIDTVNCETIKKAVDNGADILNDVSGLNYDNNMLEFVAKNNIVTVITHSNSIPAIQENNIKGDIIENIYKSLNLKIDLLQTKGMQRENIIADVGIGFGKSALQCFELLKRIDEFTTLNVPLLIGISRKSFITKSFNISNIEADIPTALYSAMLKNINIHRVHNVKLTKNFLDYAHQIL